MTAPATLPGRDSHSAAALHARLQTATREARQAATASLSGPTPRRRRLSAAEPWAMLQALQALAPAERTLSIDRAMRRLVDALLRDGGQASTEVSLDIVRGPVLVIRSGPWPVLRALLTRLSSNQSLHGQPITVLCHHRDAAPLAALAGDVALDLRPLHYPRFEAFNPATLRQLLEGGTWNTTIVLDAARDGRGDALEHVTTALRARRFLVWNAGGTSWQQRTLRSRLGREQYALLRGLLRWHARRLATG